MSNDYVYDLVSVIIPTYRRFNKLARSIKSVLDQTYNNLEILVVNDNDPDDEYTVALKAMLNSFKSDKIFLIEQDKHTNGAVARNLGIKIARGEYIAFLDDDDYWYKNKLEVQVKVLKRLDKSYGGVTCKNVVFRDGKLVKVKVNYKDGYVYKSILNRRIEVSTVTLLLRHESLDRVGGFNPTLRRHQEVQLLTFFTSRFKIKLVKEYLVTVDVSDNQNRPNSTDLIQIKQDFYNSVIPVIEQLSKRERKIILIMNNFEIAGIIFKYESKLGGMIKGLIIFKSLRALFFSSEIIYKKIVSKILCIILRGELERGYLKE